MHTHIEPKSLSNDNLEVILGPRVQSIIAKMRSSPPPPHNHQPRNQSHTAQLQSAPSIGHRLDAAVPGAVRSGRKSVQRPLQHAAECQNHCANRPRQSTVPGHPTRTKHYAAGNPQRPTASIKQFTQQPTPTPSTHPPGGHLPAQWPHDDAPSRHYTVGRGATIALLVRAPL